LGNALTQVIVTPTILYWSSRASRGRPPRPGEVLTVMTARGIASPFAFVLMSRGYSLTVAYLPVPLLIWAAVRLRPFGTANAISLVAVVAMIGAVQGSGVFADEASHSSMLSLQLFLLALGVSLLSLSILI